jgi:oxygen-independent coproporphyrinogen-3 oxidase
VRIHTEEPVGVYIHVPYCVSKCPYCDFNSVEINDSSPSPCLDPAREKRYVDAVLKELSTVASVGAPGELKSVYMGGGTPTVLSPGSIGSIIGGVVGRFKPSISVEITVEANPGTIGAVGLKGLKQAGVNRLSIGAQSFSGRILRTLSRVHTADKSLEVIQQARAAGFDNLGVDLIFGVPGQSLADWEETLQRTVALSPEHVSLYGLTIEPGTPFGHIYAQEEGKDGAEGDGRPSGTHAPTASPALPQEETVIEMYKAAISLLTKAGFVHYEISNFALPGKESVHNTGYWRGQAYLGLGPGAHTYLKKGPWGTRGWNERDPDEYLRLVEEKGSARVGGEELSREEAIVERVMLGLRMLGDGGEGIDGIDGKKFKDSFGKYPMEELAEWKTLEEEGLLLITGQDVRLTTKGALLSDEVFLRLLTPLSV